MKEQWKLQGKGNESGKTRTRPETRKEGMGENRFVSTRKGNGGKEKETGGWEGSSQQKIAGEKIYCRL